MVFCCDGAQVSEHGADASTETARLIRDWENGGGGGEGVWRWGEREIIYLSLHCHHQNDSCIKMGSDESHFNVSLIVRDRVARQCPHGDGATQKWRSHPSRLPRTVRDSYAACHESVRDRSIQHVTTCV